MGQFIDQVQALNSEARQKRLAREQREKEKQQKEKLQIQLYNIIDSYFHEGNAKQTYFKLLQDEKKWEIIAEITRNEKQENFINTIYFQTLQKIYHPCAILEKEQERQQKEHAQQLAKQEKEQQAKKQTDFKQVFTVIFYILAVILGVISGFVSRRNEVGRKKKKVLKPSFFYAYTFILFYLKKRL